MPVSNVNFFTRHPPMDAELASAQTPPVSAMPAPMATAGRQSGDYRTLFASAVSQGTAAARALRQCGSTSDGWSARGLMEKIMRKSNDSSKLDRAPQVRKLRDDELENVSGTVHRRKPARPSAGVQ